MTETPCNRFSSRAILKTPAPEPHNSNLPTSSRTGRAKVVAQKAHRTSSSIPSTQKPVVHISMASPSMTPRGMRPSLISFSKREISWRLFAFLIRSARRACSVSVNLTRVCLPLPWDAAPMPFVVAAESACVNEFSDFCCEIWCGFVSGGRGAEFGCGIFTLTARSVGSSAVPKSSSDFSRSASVTFWKSKKRTDGQR
jgi:hypothetical protein